jgi:hypothetical protein
MADWATISSMATAGGTLVLAVATFTSIRSANRAARVAERSLLAAQRPVLIPSREDDPIERVRFGDGVYLNVPGHGCSIELHDDKLYMAIGLRNGGAGLAVIHGWRVEARARTDSVMPDLDGFRRQIRDLYIPDGETGYWQGAIRDPADPDHAALREATVAGSRVLIDILYGDYEGGQRSIARFGVASSARVDPEGDSERAEAVRYWNVDGDSAR